MEIPEKLGPYRVFGLLGRGGMSEVYRAEKADGTVVALKVLPDATVLKVPQFLIRFKRETQAMMALSHPNIVTIVDAGECEGWYYIAMEIMEGDSLKDALATGPLPIGRLVRLMRETASAVVYCHAQGILHRDLKPANIFLDREGRSRIFDFGLSKSQTDQPLTTAGKRIGTPRYMAPEVVMGGPPDERSDVYQLGLVYYEAACGEAAFPDSDVMTVLQKVLTADPPSLLSRVEGLPAPLAHLIESCLVKNPTGRCQGAAEVAARLDRIESEGAPLRGP